jgi:hypothetical protein
VSAGLGQVPELGPLERELLLTCGRLELDATRADRLDELLDDRLDWDAVLWYARLHSVAPLVHRHLKRSSRYENVPSDARRGLLALYQRADYQNRFFARAHREISEALAREGLEVIVTKGLAVLELVYGSLAARPLIDIDLLAPPDGARAVEQVILEQGYVREPLEPKEAVYRWWAPQVYLAARREIRVVFVLKEGPVGWPRIHRLEPETLWAHAERASIAGAETRVFSPVDLVIYLCVSADNMGYLNRVALGSVDPVELLFGLWSNNRLIRFTDLYEVLRRYRDQLDWDFLVERATDSGLREPVHVSLSLTTALLGPVVPPEVIERLGTQADHRLREWMFDAVDHGGRGNSPPGLSRRLARSWWSALPEHSRLDLARFLCLLEVAFPEPRTLGLRYPGRSGAALAATYPAHAAYTLSRSVVSFLGTSASHSRRRLGEALSRRRGPALPAR